MDVTFDLLYFCASVAVLTTLLVIIVAGVIEVFQRYWG